MAYDYSPAFLEANAEAVQLLRQAGLERKTVAWACDSADHVKSVQYWLCNLLASLAMHDPQFREVRFGIRTWVELDNESGKWQVNVGPKRPKQRGARPKDLFNHPAGSGVHPKGNVLDALRARGVAPPEDVKLPDLTKDQPLHELRRVLGLWTLKNNNQAGEVMLVIERANHDEVHQYIMDELGPLGFTVRSIELHDNMVSHYTIIYTPTE